MMHWAPPEAEPWMQWSACRDTDPDVFFPDRGSSALEAKRVCGNCPVPAECLDYALKHDERFGVWGGLSERARASLKRRGLGRLTID